MNEIHWVWIGKLELAKLRDSVKELEVENAGLRDRIKNLEEEVLDRFPEQIELDDWMY